MATIVKLLSQLTAAMAGASPEDAAKVRASLTEAGLVPASRGNASSGRKLDMPKDAKAQGAAMLRAYRQSVGTGKYPSLGENKVRFPMQVVGFFGIPAKADGSPDWQAAYVAGQCVRLALGHPLGGAMDFSAKESGATGHYCFVGVLWPHYSLRRDKDGKYRLLKLDGKAPAAPTGKQATSAKPSSTPSNGKRSEAGGDTSKVIVHACGAKAIVGTVCSNCKQRVARATSSRTRNRDAGKPANSSAPAPADAPIEPIESPESPAPFDREAFRAALAPTE